MKISKIYCNFPDIFGPIKFNLGTNGKTALNIVIAVINHPKDEERDSHNLGKTSLIHILDFLLLKGVSEENSFLLKHKSIFDNFTFFGEFQTVSGTFVTVRRGVASASKAAFKVAKSENQNFTELSDSDWDHINVPEKKSRQILDSYFSLTEIAPWDYRKGVGYFLRTQQDYNDYFQISKFVKGSDSDWKPYLAKVLGFPYELLEAKYAIDASIAIEKSKLLEAEASATLSLDDIGKIKTRIAVKQSEVDQTQKQLDSFSFSDEESRITTKLAGETEREISRINGEIYNLTIDLNRAKDSIQKTSKIDVEKIRKLFEESSIYLPEKLVHDYEDLQEFVQKITTDRNKQLKKSITECTNTIENLTARRASLDKDRSTALSVIRDVDSLKKYKALQRTTIDALAEIQVLQSRIDLLEHAKSIRSKIRELGDEQRRLEGLIESLPESAPEKYLAISAEFHRLVKSVLGIEGNFYIKINKSGNVEFRIDTEKLVALDESKITSQSKGTTYRKLLCALFDMAVLAVYSSKKFFHFVYHDGMLEGLDNRKKISYLNAIRDLSKRAGIQYILTLIESDLPRDNEDKAIQFNDDEIILRLSDDGDGGRLFRMPEF